MNFHGTPVQFESALKLLCERMGLSVQLTKHSHDGGVDLLVEDSTPVIGGCYIIQAKRYDGSVGEPVIRDLYGTLIHEGAVKAILITTGHFTSAAVAFAKGKPIELVDGEVLEKLVIKFRLSSEFFSDVPRSGSSSCSGSLAIDDLEEQREHFRSLLIELRKELVDQTGRDNPHVDLALAIPLRQPGNVNYREGALREVDAALNRIENGTYGICESCGDRVGNGRLATFPHSRLCLECESRSSGPIA